MKRVILAAMTLLVLASCNTIQGIGQDIKDGGRAMDHAINGSSEKKDY